MVSHQKPSPPNPLSLKIRTEVETSDTSLGPNFQGEGECGFRVPSLAKSQ